MTMLVRCRLLSALAAIASACGEEGHSGTGGNPPDAVAIADVNDADTDHDSAIDTARDAAPDGDERPTIVRRGEYLVKHVALCSDCHTPRMADGRPDPARFLAGVPGLFRLPRLGPDGGYGVVSGKNLTSDVATGLGSWTDAEIKKAFLDGIGKDGKALSSTMPYYVLHNMSGEDADAVVAFLRTAPAVNNVIAERNFEVAAPAQPIAAAAIPNPMLEATDPSYASAMRGKYLAANIGICMDCHTEHVPSPMPLDTERLFAGGHSFVAADIGIAAPPFPSVIHSANITPHPSGIEGWTAAAVALLLKHGLEPDGVRICPPMPVGPWGAFGGLTDRDARDIGNYIIHLPPTGNSLPLACHDEIPRDAGVSGLLRGPSLKNEE
jgi:hypothetical protein